MKNNDFIGVFHCYCLGVFAIRRPNAATKIAERTAKNTTNEKEKTMTTTQTTLAQIAKKHLRVETLEVRNRDALDFPEVGVWGLKSALQAAHAAGWADAVAAAKSAPAIDADAMLNALRENLSPLAVTSIAAHLYAAYTKSPEVDDEVRRFADQLVKLLGGNNAYARLMDEVGV